MRYADQAAAQVKQSGIDKGCRMLERLGLVLYWGTALLALIIVGIAAWGQFQGALTEPVLFGVSVGGGAAGVWCLWRATLSALLDGG